MFFSPSQAIDVAAVQYQKAIFLAKNAEGQITFCKHPFWEKKMFRWENSSVFELNTDDILPKEECIILHECVGEEEEGKIVLSEGKKTKMMKLILD